MPKGKWVLIAFLIAIQGQSCSKKEHLNRSASSTAHAKADTTQGKKSTVTIKPKLVVPTPQVLLVNDKFASITPDGRYYYDLRGHRYWRNYKDGKYYLFNQSMYKDDAFKAPR